jgi:hypothetical protein
MSEDKLSEDKFLARWSRRKQEAKAPPTLPDAATHDDVQSASPPAAEDDEAEFDLSSLPSIDSITSATDIKAFLRKGIPQELTRAALRRAWSADPAIRDFVGLAENAWDFNDPSAMPGFGPLDCSEGELAALVDRIIGGLRKSAEAQLETSVEAADSSRELRQAETSTVEVVIAEPATTEIAPVPVATQPAVAESTESAREPIRRHTHGGALPR